MDNRSSLSDEPKDLNKLCGHLKDNDDELVERKKKMEIYASRLTGQMRGGCRIEMSEWRLGDFFLLRTWQRQRPKQ